MSIREAEISTVRQYDTHYCLAVEWKSAQLHSDSRVERRVRPTKTQVDRSVLAGSLPAR